MNFTVSFVTIKKILFFLLIFRMMMIAVDFTANANVLSTQIILDTLELRIDPRQALNDSVTAGEIIERTDYIPLQTPEGIFLGKVDQLEITDDHIFILDKRNKIVNSRSRSAILIFKKNGEFEAIISITKISYFSLNRELNQIAFRDDDSHSDWMFYDYKGKLIRKEKRLLEFKNFYFLDKRTIAFYKNYTNLKNTGSEIDSSPDNAEYNLILVKDGKLAGKSLKFDTTKITQVTDMFSAGKNFYLSDKLYVMPEYEYNCYEVFNGGEVKKSLSFVFPAQFTLPKTFFTQPLSKRIEYFGGNKNLIYAISDFYRVGNFYLFKLNFSKSFPQVFFYDLDAKILSALSAMESDETTHFMPLGESVYANEGLYYYSVITNSEITQAVNNLNKKKQSYSLPKTIEDYLSIKTNANKNPLIIRHKIRS